MIKLIAWMTGIISLLVWLSGIVLGLIGIITLNPTISWFGLLLLLLSAGGWKIWKLIERRNKDEWDV